MKVKSIRFILFVQITILFKAISRKNKFVFLGTSNERSPDSHNQIPSVNSTRNIEKTTQGIQEIVMEHNYAEFPSTSSANTFEDVQEQDSHEDQSQNKFENDGIIIKLKYINDDLKMVDGKLDELLGDFKKFVIFS